MYAYTVEDCVELQRLTLRVPVAAVLSTIKFSVTGGLMSGAQRMLLVC